MEKQPNKSLDLPEAAMSIVPSKDKVKATWEKSGEVVKETSKQAAKAGKDALDEATKMGKKVAKTDVGKAAIAGAVVGALVAIPIPLFGPPLGAVVGAGVAIFLMLKHGPRTVPERPTPSRQPESAAKETPADVISSIRELEILRKAGTITDEEFKEQKAKLLKRI